MGLVYNLFPEKSARAIDALWQDGENRGLLAREIGKKLMSSKKIVTDSPEIQLMSLLSQANFVHGEEEPVLVAGMMRKHMRDLDPLPLISRHSGRELAERCLLSLGLLHPAMEERYKRRAAPKPDFYREVGIRTMEEIGVDSVAANFKRWESFLGEVFN